MIGLVVCESPRWHEGRLWFSNRGAKEIIAADVEGNAEAVASFAQRASPTLVRLERIRGVLAVLAAFLVRPPVWGTLRA